MRVRQELVGHALEQHGLDLESACSPIASPVRFATRKTCVSTARVDSPKATFSTTFAVLRPTPGRASSASRVRGTWPPCCLDQDAAGGVQVLRLAAEQADRLDRVLERRQAEGEHLLRRRRDREQPPRRLVDAAVGRLRREQHRREQLEHARVFELAGRVGIGVAQRREEGNDRRRPSSPAVAARRAQEPARAARARAERRGHGLLPARRRGSAPTRGGARRRVDALLVALVAARAPVRPAPGSRRSSRCARRWPAPARCSRPGRPAGRARSRCTARR